MSLKSVGRRGKIFIAAAVVWFAIVVLAYFAVHKPANVTQLTALSDLLLVSAGWVSTIALANLLGWALLRTVSDLERLERLGLQVGAGLATLGFVVLAIGLVGAYSKLLLWAIVLLPLPVALWRLNKDLRGFPRPSDRVLAAVVGVAVLLVTVRALAPPTAWDSLVYHLTGPRLYLESNRLLHSIDLPYLGFPKAGSMLFLLGLQLAGPALAQLFHATFMLLTLALIPSLVRTAAPNRTWLAAAILIAVPSAALMAGWAYVEWITMFAGVAAYILIRLPRPSPERFVDRNLALAGFFAALAINSKYTAIWLIIGLLVVVLLNRRSISQSAGFAVLTALFAIPYLATTAILTGNPIYPFVFDGILWDQHRALWFSRFGSGLGLAELVAAPWEATIWGLEGGFYEGHRTYGATVGPLLLALIPLVALRWLLDPSARQGQVRDLVVIVVIAYAGWLAQLSSSNLLIQTRLIFPALPFLAALAAVGFDTIGQIGRWGLSARFVIGGLVAFVLALTISGMTLGAAASGELGVVLGAESRETYLQRRLGYHYLAMVATGELGDGAKVQFLWEPRSYYCEPRAICEPDALLDKWWHSRQHSASAAEIVKSWEEKGATHVLYNRAGAAAARASGLAPLLAGDWAELETLLGEHLIPLEEFGDVYVLYEIDT